jgi:23S rRNA pseudouridine1911/1915/1917 synthase
MELIIDEKFNNKLIREILIREFGLSGRILTKVKQNNRIFLNGQNVYVNIRVKTGDILKVDLDFEEDHEQILAQEYELDILFEDEYIIAINKPADTVVHPTSTHKDCTLANYLKYYYEKNGIRTMIRPINRLDRDTTGVILFAKKQFIQNEFTKQMHSRTFTKEYLGIVCGDVPDDNGVINLPISRSKNSIMLREINEAGDKSITGYEVVERFSNLNTALLRFKLETGRTHQIRIHCLASGFPLIGDGLYGRKLTYIINRQALHSYTTCFVHPISDKPVVIIAPLPKDFLDACNTLSSGSFKCVNS